MIPVRLSLLDKITPCLKTFAEISGWISLWALKYILVYTHLIRLYDIIQKIQELKDDGDELSTEESNVLILKEEYDFTTHCIAIVMFIGLIILGGIYLVRDINQIILFRVIPTWEKEIKDLSIAYEKRSE